MLSRLGRIAGQFAQLSCVAYPQNAYSHLAQASKQYATLQSLRTFCAQPIATPAKSPSAVATLKEAWQICKQLSKFRLSLLVASTASAGYVLGSDEKIEWAGLGWTSLGTFLTAACANTLNQVYEIRNDSLMKRTRNRPLPQGRVSIPAALAFAATTGMLGTAIWYTKGNTITAGLGTANILLYAGIYTPLKTVSIVNTYVGALVGAIPPLMGWAAASGGINAGAYILAAGLFYWQLPHFLALAWLCKDDYARGGYRMLTLIDATGRRTAACCFRNCLYLFPVGLAAVGLGVTSYGFAYYSALVSGGLCATAGVFYQSPTVPHARLLFRASLLHLPLWMAGLIWCRRTDAHEVATLDHLRQSLHEWQLPRKPHVGADENERKVAPAPFPFLPAPTFAASAVANKSE